ncbi:MAG: T9SS type A sorting domain-containing protein, partial [Bacteroidetes bacterium]|nr:T9SS type A sorting domain-containing protein [Bacteroidota bacterium]
SPVFNASSFSSSARLNDAFFIKVPYVGAFGDIDWTCGWAKYAGGATPCAPEVVSGDITSNTTWVNSKEYILNGFVYVKNCATLTIEPGTIIRGDKGSRGTLIVTRCAKLVADGTADAPIIFTSNSPTPATGDWGGIVILGRASTNGSFNGVAGLQAIEGDLNNANGDGLFGNGDLAGPASQYDNDNSGILRYVRIEYPGIVITPGNEINGLTMGGVGRGTTLDYIQVSYSNDDSYEWFGGNVNAKHLIAYRGLDDDFDTDNGFSGNLQFLLGVRDPQVSDAAGASNGFESDNDANSTSATPKTAATISNATIIAPATVDATQFFSRGALLRRNTEESIFNTIFVGAWPNAGVRIDGQTTADNATSGKLEVKNCAVAGSTTVANTNASGFDVLAWYNTAAFNNLSYSSSGGVQLANPFNVDLPNAQPNLLSPVLTAASFTSSARLNNAFFTPVSYIGAFGRENGAVNDWTCKWAAFKGGSSDCTTNTEDFDQLVNTLKLYPTVTGDYTNLEIDLKENVNLNVTIYGMNGTQFGTLLDEQVSAGHQVIGLNVSNLNAGFYFVQIQAGNAIKTEKLIVVR